MRILGEIWQFRAVLGLGVLLLLAYFGWQRLKKEGASAQRSIKKFDAQTKVVQSVDLPDIGVEAAWMTSPPQK